MSDTIDDLFGGGQAQGFREGGQILRNADTNFVQGNLDPWIKGGEAANQNWINSLNQMRDPNQFVNEIMSKYSQSPMAKQQIQAANRASNQAAAASGMLGSGEQQQAMQEHAKNIVQADQQNYLNNVMGVLGRYQSGQEQLSGQGLQGAQGLDQFLSEEARMRAQIAAEEAQAREKQSEGQAQGKTGAVGTGLGILGDFI